MIYVELVLASGRLKRFICLLASRETLYSAWAFLMLSCDSIGRFSVLKPFSRMILMTVSFAFILTNLKLWWRGGFYENQTSHVLQLMVTFTPLSPLMNCSLVPCSCLMITRYLVGACLGRESLIEIWVISTNLELACECLADRGGIGTHWASFLFDMVVREEESVTHFNLSLTCWDNKSRSLGH